MSTPKADRYIVLKYTFREAKITKIGVEGKMQLYPQKKKNVG